MSGNAEVEELAMITCPDCGHQKKETRSLVACQYFYQCEQCRAILTPLDGDCCVVRSFGEMVVPPVHKQ